MLIPRPDAVAPIGLDYKKFIIRWRRQQMIDNGSGL